jgi:hypothetical protein
MYPDSPLRERMQVQNSASLTSHPASSLVPKGITLTASITHLFQYWKYMFLRIRLIDNSTLHSTLL